MTATSVDRRRRRISNAIVGAVLFAALAPMITLIVAIPALVFQERQFLGRVTMAAFLVVYFLPVAYMISAAPAALAGGYAGYVRHRLYSHGTWLAIGALETGLTVGLIMLTGYLLPLHPMNMIVVPPFFIAGTVCAWLLSRWFAWRDRRRGSEAPSPRPKL